MADVKDLTNLSPPTNFTVTFDSSLREIDGQKNLARLRIFYKDLNRNGTYITEEFAERLLFSLPGTPVVGEFDKEKDDFTQHTGIEKTKGYGFVPFETNFAWENHEDEDGEVRSYACCDVVLWTNRYEEAKKIVGKKHSMELDPDSIDGFWEIKNGLPVFTFTKGDFFGLCILGKNYTPCFEGSSFYTLEEDKKELIRQLRIEYISNLELFSNKKEGGGQMPDLNEKINKFKLSHDEIYDLIWEAVNPNYQEGEYNAAVLVVYDNYAITRKYDANEYTRLYYTKNDNDNTVTLGEEEEVFIVDVTKDEYTALQYIQELNGGFTAAVENLKVVESFKEKNPDFDFTVDFSSADEIENEDEEEKDKGEFSEIENNKLKEYEAEIEELKNKNKELGEYKESIEKAEKEKILEEYSEKISSENLKKFNEEVIKSMSVEDLEKELAYILVKNSNFTVVTRIPNVKDERSDSVSKILQSYVIED